MPFQIPPKRKEKLEYFFRIITMFLATGRYLRNIELKNFLT